MAKKHKSQHEDELAVDEEREAPWTGDAEQHEDEEVPPVDPPPPPPPPPPPAVRIQAVIAQLQHHAAHNAPVPQSTIKELQSIATALGQDGGAPAMPVIDSIEPTTGPEGTMTLTVTGQNFSPESVLCYGDINQDTTVSPDATQLTATFESGAPGIYDVNVHDPAGDSNTMTFEVT